MTTDTIVIGASAGGLRAVQHLLKQIRNDLPASIFVVLHLSINASMDFIIRSLQDHTLFRCTVPSDGETIKQGYLYVAPPDHHMLIKNAEILIRKGAKENRFRPSIDALFRSAAVYRDSRAIGILLSGLLDDGVAGMDFIKRSGGITIVQDPNEAEYNQMPSVAIKNVAVDYILPIAQMGYVIDGIVHRPVEGEEEIPKDIRIEAEIAERVLTDIRMVQDLGEQSPYECPICNGSLWYNKHSNFTRLRCHVGHTFSMDSLYKDKSEQIEDALWIAMRMLEERRNMFVNARDREMEQKKDYAAAWQDQKVKETELQIQKIKDVLLGMKD